MKSGGVQNWLLLVASRDSARGSTGCVARKYPHVLSGSLIGTRIEGRERGGSLGEKSYPRQEIAVRNRKILSRTHLYFARRRRSRWLRATQVADCRGSELLLSVDPCGTPSWGSELRLRLKAEEETIMLCVLERIAPRSVLHFTRLCAHPGVHRGFRETHTFGMPPRYH